MTKHPVLGGHLGDAFLKHFIFINRELERQNSCCCHKHWRQEVWDWLVMMQHAAQAQRLSIAESGEFECLLPSPLPSYFRSYQLHVCLGRVTESF